MFARGKQAASGAALMVDGCSSTAGYAITIASVRAPAPRAHADSTLAGTKAQHAGSPSTVRTSAALDTHVRAAKGNGGTLALPLLPAACAILSTMATLETASISERSAA
ncbi:nicotinate-nucleotide--dimethylbenzimidazole phosphoribosyltransferase [Lysobacter korlensis]|uniref:Nicotinate-nucleotide--dimethylbenzimidazole phosphoribosyltransferase n=1 Tax=Lysobacter korlensis TaxID=553636 RepID=A0ABV6RTK8_9GAMM